MEKDRENKFGLGKILLLAFVFCVPGLFLGARAAAAASLYLTPSAATYAVGQSFTVTVVVASADQSMNAVSGVINFPSDKLDVISVSKAGSVIGLWVQDPSFSDNTITFSGIALNPGFTGAAGKVVSINFKAKAVGAATLSFLNGSVLANDGKGTNILNALGKSALTLSANLIPNAPAPTAPAKPTPASAPPSAPVITSPSHPDPTAWYAKNIADLRWALPGNVTAVSFAVDQKPDTLPPPLSAGLFDSYSTKNVGDGVWYFHLRFKNSKGWGPAAAFRFAVDTTPPNDFNIRLVDGTETINPQPTVIFNTTDAASGIDHYEIKVGDGNAVNLAANIDLTSNPYVLPAQDPGEHRILVVAVDKAGNHASASADFTIDALSKPTITEYAQRLRAGDQLVIKGKTGYPNTPVTISVEQNNGNPQSASVRTDDQGNFTYVADNPVTDGIYKVWAQTIDDRGAKSALSDQVTIVVETAPAVEIASTGIPIWLAVLPLLAILLLIWYLIWVYRRKLTKIKRNTGRETDEIEAALHEAFDILREQLDDKVHSLEHARKGSRLTELEEKIIREFKKDLAVAERKVENKIRTSKKRKGAE